VDVRFSIDDLAAKTEPEPWDGLCFLALILAYLLGKYDNCSFRAVLTFGIRNPELRSAQQPPRHEEGRACVLLPLKLQGARHRGHNGDCARAFG
jgi:hypothetical protein